MNRYFKKGLFLLTIGVLVAGCIGGYTKNQEEYFKLGSALTKLSKALDFVISFEEPPIETTSPELLGMATSNNPSLLEPFEDYQLKVIRKDSSAIILVCSTDGQYAILEDVTCSAAMERHAWKEQPAPPCLATLQPATICQ